MNKRRFLVGAAALATAPIGHAQGGRPRLRYGGDAAFAPFESLDPQGRPQGFQVDLLAELGQVLDVDFDLTLLPWEQTEAGFRAGRFDLVAMVDTAQRRRWALFARGHATPALAIYRRHGQAPANGLQDLVGLRIAVPDSEAMRDTLANWLAGVPGPFVRVADARQALDAVRRGDADVALLPRAYADPLVDSGLAGGITASGLNLVLQTYAMAVAPGQPALQAQLQRGLDELEANGRLEALRVRWLSSHRDAASRALLEQGLARQRGWTWAVGGLSVGGLALLGGGLRRRGQRVAMERQRRQDAELALSRAQELLERSFAHHVDPMLVVERASGRVTDANQALCSMLGVPMSALVGHTLAGLAQHIDAGALDQLVQSLDSDGGLNAAPLRLRHADGSRRDCLVSADLFRIDAADQVFCIVRDITDQLAGDAAMRAGYEQLAGELAQARRQMQQALDERALAQNRLQEFTRSVAHDLKSPLNAVAGFAGLLQQRLRAGHLQEAVGYAEHIERAAHRMTAMIDALTSLAQVSRRPLQRQPVDMKRLVQQTWALLAAARPERRVDLRLDELPAADADPDLVAQVWQNLLDNAIKYTARASLPRIAVDSFRDARGTWYRVTDNGAGFDMARAQQLFQPFQRMHPASQFEGSGVGLSLVRRIIDHHGGDIRLRSSPGVGTVVQFTVDAAAPDPASRV